MSSAVLFVVGSGVQLDSARRVVTHLVRPAQALNIWDGSVGPLAEVKLPGHMAPVTVDRLSSVSKATAAWAKANPGGVLVTPQDVGLVYRRAIAAARRKRIKIAFLPDGAVSGGKVTGRSMLGGLVPVADAMLRGVGFVAGRHGEMGACRPELALSWGPAWSPVFADRGAELIIESGNPRSDDLANIEPPHAGRILLCSQPMDHAAIGGPVAATKWYEFVERIALSAPEGDFAVRLHPAEADAFDALPIGAATKKHITAGTELSEDIAWSGALVSWASTTMMEAAGAGRAVVSLAVNDAAAEMARGYFFQRDPRVVSALTDAVPDFAALSALVVAARASQEGLADDYLVNIGSAAKTAAAALDEL
ncbi:MAG: hypothetical protein HOQ05_02735 [Corynebacteriales bacterium]|nr:hypothetical protein [Mycobacteriales bacterium]